MTEQPYIKGSLSEDDVFEFLKKSRDKAYAPSSNFHVGVVLEVTSDGEKYYFGGSNIENQNHRLSMHGEESALAQAVTTLGNSFKIENVHVIGGSKDNPDTKAVTSCCGKCRQRIFDFCGVGEDIAITYYTLTGEKEQHSIKEQLPNAFGASSFLSAEEIQKMREQKPRISPMEIVKGTSLSEEEIYSWASSFKQRGYVPDNDEVAIIKLSNGAYVAGVKLEDAAYNGSGAFQGAIANAVSVFGGHNIKIEEAYYLKKEKGKVEYFAPDPADLQFAMEFADSSKDLPIKVLGNGDKSKELQSGEVGFFFPKFSLLRKITDDIYKAIMRLADVTKNLIELHPAAEK